MTEKMPKPPQAKEGLSAKEQEHTETAALFAEEIEKRTKIERSIVSAEEHAEKIREFEAAFSAYEAEHDVEALFAITELTADTADDHPTRYPARIAAATLVHVGRYLNTVSIENMTEEDKERFASLQKRYRYIQRAIGSVNGGRVLHDWPRE